MMNNPIVRIIVRYVQLYGLLIHYFYLRIIWVYLHVKLYAIKLAGAALIEAVKIEYCIKSLSNGDRIIFAACIAFSIYLLALILLAAFGLDVTVWT